MRSRELLRMYCNRVCRGCLSRIIGTPLSREDCVYWSYRGICANCGEDKHIVHSLKFSGKVKTLFAGRLSKATF